MQAKSSAVAGKLFQILCCVADLFQRNDKHFTLGFNLSPKSRKLKIKHVFLIKFDKRMANDETVQHESM